MTRRHLFAGVLPGFAVHSRFETTAGGGLDTAAKRLSALSGWMPWKRIPIVPDGTITVFDRAALISLYGGEA